MTVQSSGAATMHLGTLNATSTKLSRGQWSGTVRVPVEDGANAAVHRATVTGRFSQGSVNWPGSCVTDFSGWCSIASGTMPSKEGNADFQVTGVSHATLFYRPRVNHTSTVFRLNKG